MTCTPSDTALSIADTLSLVKQLFVLPVPSVAAELTKVKQTL